MFQATLTSSVFSMRNMSDHEDSDADRLRRLFDDLPITKKQFANQVGLPGGSSMLSQHLSGHRPVSVEAAIAYARGFSVGIDTISPAAADVIRQGAGLLTPNPLEGVSATDVQGVPQMISKWPFRRIDPAAWQSLDAEDRGWIERMVADELEKLAARGKRRRA